MKNRVCYLNRSGYSIIIVFCFILLLTGIGLSLSFYSKYWDLQTTDKKKIFQTQNIIKVAALSALTELQNYAGVDSISTANISYRFGTPEVTGNWLAIYNSKRKEAESRENDKKEPLILVSKRGNWENTDILMLKNPIKGSPEMAIPWHYLNENIRYAYYIIDESHKASLSLPAINKFEKNFDEEELPDIIQLSKHAPNLQKNFKDLKDASDPILNNYLALMPDIDAFLGTEYAKSFIDDWKNQNFLTSAAFAVLSNPHTNALKKNLSDPTFKNEIFPEDFLTTYQTPQKELREAPNSGIEASSGDIKYDGDFHFFSNLRPVPIDIKLHFSFFNVRSDGLHRIRFHVSSALWNPYSVPILSEDDDYFGLFDFEGMPTFLITNKNTDASFDVTLSNFHIGKISRISQDHCDKTLNAYCKIFDFEDQGFGGFTRKKTPAGFHAGEVFYTRMPDTSDQPEGLSRVTTLDSWRYQTNESLINKPPAHADGNKWFHPKHEIQIESIPNILPTNFILRAYNGKMKQNKTPSEYAPPIFQFKNLILPNINIAISGNEYNRKKSDEHSIENSQIVYHLRLKTEDEEAINALFKSIDIRNGQFNFNNPIVKNAFEITVSTQKDAKEKATPFYQNGIFFDYAMNKHRSSNNKAHFSCIRLFDVPNRTAISTAAFRHHGIKNIPSLQIGEKSTNEKNTELNKLFDHYFFSGAEKKSAKKIYSINPRITTTNPNEKIDLYSKNLAEKILIKGAFNINSEIPNAWKTVLATTLPRWKIKTRQKLNKQNDNDDEKNLKNIFFRLPYSAQSKTFASNECLTYSDKELETLPHDKLSLILCSQGFRALSDDKIKTLSQNIAKRIKINNSAHQPFTSLLDFINSGIIEEAITESNINTINGFKIPEWFPTAISQSDIIEHLSTFAFPRGDTFKIRVRAEILNPITLNFESCIGAEIKVQRTPHFFDNSQIATTPYENQNAQNRLFGRRFKIISFKYLTNDEID